MNRPAAVATPPPHGVSLPPSRFRLGVRSLLFIAFGTSAVAPVALLGLNQAERWAASEIEAADRQALAAAHAAADHLTVAMLGYVQAAESFSAYVGHSGGLSLDRLEGALDAHTRHHPDFFHAYVADTKGTSLLHEEDGLFRAGGIDYSDRDYFREILKTGRSAISGVRIGRVTQVLAVQVAAPIRDATGSFLGITCSSLDLGAITDQAQGSVRGMAEGRLVVVDGEGRRIADSSATARLDPADVSKIALFAAVPSGQAEWRKGVDDRQIEVRGVAVGLKAPVASWRVVATAPQAVVDAQARLVKRQTGSLVLGLILAVLVLSGGLAAWLARPLRALAMTARAVTRGEFDALPSVSRSAPREIAQLAEAVSAMIGRLRGHAHDLESQVAERTLDLSRANAEISSALSTIQAHERRMLDDIEKARLFQAKLLPSLPPRASLQVATHYAALEQVSGDIYDVVELANGTLRIFLADATGHGVQASMRTIILKSAYDRLKTEHFSPSEVLSELNAHLVEEFPDGDLHCTACCIDIHENAEGAEVRYANAGSAPLYVFSAGAPALEVYAEGPLLGVDVVMWPEPCSFKLRSGDVLIIASDGLVEQSNVKRQRFEAQLVAQRLSANIGARDALNEILAEFARFSDGVAARDDVTVIAASLTRS